MRTWVSNRADDLFVIALEWAKNGRPIAPRGIRTREIDGPVSLTLTNLDKNLVTLRGRKLNYFFALGEVLWIWSGDNSLNYIVRFNKRMAEFSDDGVSFYGAYGPRIRSQLAGVIDKLTSDMSTRQAVITIWRENPPKTKDTPCTVMMHFMIRDNKLHLTVYMRSNDIWLGLPYDIHTFTTIQKTIAATLGVGYGNYTHIAGSLHIYETDLEKADATIDSESVNISMPRPKGSDLRDLFNLSRCIMRGDEPPPFVLPEEGEFYQIHGELLIAHDRRQKRLPYTLPYPYSEIVRGNREHD